MSEFQILKIMDTLSIMRYFDIKEVMYDLEHSQDISSSPGQQSTTYSITEKGSRLLAPLKADIRASVRDSIDRYLKDNKKVESKKKEEPKRVKLIDSCSEDQELEEI